MKCYSDERQAEADTANAAPWHLRVNVWTEIRLARVSWVVVQEREV